MERLDQGILHPLLEQPETDMSRPGIEPRPPQASTLAKSYSNIYKLLFGTSTYEPATIQYYKKFNNLELELGASITNIFVQ
jgi:hypothetical protein